MSCYKKHIKKILPKYIIDFLKSLKAKFSNKIISNVYQTNYKRNCLIVYITVPFRKGIASSHQNSWQVVEMARIISSFDYNVDVIDYEYNRNHFVKKYDLLIDLHPRDNCVYQTSLKTDCIKIAYMTGSNTRFSNNAEKTRLDNLERRKHKRLIQRRSAVLISRKIEKYNAMFFIGNKYNLQTFSEFKLPPVYFIKNNGYLLNIQGNKRSEKNFCFIGSFGQVHKGLDLLLEVFAYKCTDCNLYICSSFKEEEDFCNLYNKELYKTKNIFPIGFINIEGEQFKEVVEKCSYMIMPSCSEGLAGSVITAMSAGLIPIVSRECGFEDDEVIHLEDCSLECLEKTIDEYAFKNIDWINSESERVKRIVEERYSQKCFSDSIFKAFNDVLQQKN